MIESECTRVCKGGRRELSFTEEFQLIKKLERITVMQSLVYYLIW